mgnify:CR=1 FL=1
MSEEKKMDWKAGKNTHENIIFSCFGGLSNTGITSAQASMEAVEELGLDKAAIGCLPAVSQELSSVLGKINASEDIVTVDGCPKECARKTIESAGFEVSTSITLVEDIDMDKKPLHKDIGTNDLKSITEYISQEEVEEAKKVIVEAIE